MATEPIVCCASILPELTQLWVESTGHSEICVAVLDGPVDLEHPCFAGANLKCLETMVPKTPDKNGAASQHGTHVASVIFGQDGSSILGIAPNARGLIVPIFKDGPNGTMAACSEIDLARAIYQAMDHGAQVINISGGQLAASSEAHPTLTAAVRQCVDKDVLIVAAAGNNGCDCLHIPAALSPVAVVGAMDSQGKPLESSNWGQQYVERGILAVGENIIGAVPGGGTASRTGTSLATPIVSGVVALLLSIQLKRGVTPSPRTVWNALLGSAIGCDEQPVSDCRRLLAGRLNIVGALTQLTEGEIMETSDSNPLTAVENNHAQVTASVEALATVVEEPREVTQSCPTVIEGPPDNRPFRRTFVASSLPEPRGIMPSDCGCGGGSASLAYVLGQLDYDYGSEARRDSFVQRQLKDPHQPQALMNHLNENPYEATAVIWILTQDATPIYAIRPAGPFAAETYQRMKEYMNAQYNEGAERVSVPGVVSGTETLMSGQTVPVLYPELRGMYNWSTKAMLGAILGKAPAASAKEERSAYDRKQAGVQNFFERVYYELRNLGLAPQDRALNYAATNAYQILEIYQTAIKEQTQLDTIEVERSPVCRPGADCWDVKLTFFNPARRYEQARKVCRMTVDVTDVVPVTVGAVRQWYVY